MTVKGVLTEALRSTWYFAAPVEAVQVRVMPVLPAAVTARFVGGLTAARASPGCDTMISRASVSTRTHLGVAFGRPPDRSTLFIIAPLFPSKARGMYAGNTRVGDVRPRFTGG